MSRINSLKKDQIEQLSVFRDKWLRVGLCTEKADRVASERAINEVYRAAGLKEPSLKIWLESPFAGAIGASFLNQVGNQVENQVRSQVWDKVWDKVWNQVGDQVGKCGYGQHDADWLGFYQYFQKVCGINCVDKLNGLISLSENCGWVWPFENAVILTERHTILNRDEEGRLHKDGGLACGYPDGWGVYAWHGTRLPKEWGSLKSDQWKSEWLIEEKNAELRRVLLQGLGYARVLKDLGSKKIHSEGNMELHRIAKDIDMEPIQLLKVKCPSTGAFYTLRVPPGIETCETARRWTFGDEPLELLKET